VADWTADGELDVLIGAGDGNVHLYQGLCLSADFDNDGDTDLNDYTHFHDCLNGPGVPPAMKDCDDADSDADGDVDLQDFGPFQDCLAHGV
jgi:hypothetical protein